MTGPRNIPYCFACFKNRDVGRRVSGRQATPDMPPWCRAFFRTARDLMLNRNQPTATLELLQGSQLVLNLGTPSHPS